MLWDNFSGQLTVASLGVPSGRFGDTTTTASSGHTLPSLWTSISSGGLRSPSNRWILGPFLYASQTVYWPPAMVGVQVAMYSSVDRWTSFDADSNLICANSPKKLLTFTDTFLFVTDCSPPFLELLTEKNFLHCWANSGSRKWPFRRYLFHRTILLLTPLLLPVLNILININNLSVLLRWIQNICQSNFAG